MCGIIHGAGTCCPDGTSQVVPTPPPNAKAMIDSVAT